MIDHTSAVYTEYEIELSCLIKLGTICDENQTGQQRDQSIGLVYDEIKTEQSRPIWSSEVCYENQIR